MAADEGGNGSSLLEEVIITQEIYEICTLHAYTTEQEEIMGLCMGWPNEEKTKVFMASISIFPRSDKQSDRVEIDYRDLIKGQEEAERLNETTQQKCQCVGWYHSHPNITIHPSPVDLNTQLSFQNMDSTWVGLIFGVYQWQKDNHGIRSEVIAFQTKVDSVGARTEHSVKVTIVPSINYDLKPFVSHCLGQAVHLCNTLVEEETKEYTNANKRLGKNNILGKLHNSSVHSATLARILELYIHPIHRNLNHMS